MAEEQENTPQYEMLTQNDVSEDELDEHSASYQPVPPSSPNSGVSLDQQHALSKGQIQHDVQNQKKASGDTPVNFSDFFFSSAPKEEKYVEPSPREENEGYSEVEIEGEEEESSPLPFPLPQYVQPQMPTDLRICDKYFVKPGQYRVTDSGTLVPGTGVPPPNIPLPQAIKDDILIPLLNLIVAKEESQFSFFKGLVDHCSIDTLEKIEDEVSEEEVIFESFDSEYLKSNLGIPLTLALAEIVMKKPTDPIHYLGHWLFKWHYNQEDRQIESDKINEIIHEREIIAAAEKSKHLEVEEITHELVEDLITDMLIPQDLFDGRGVSGDEEQVEINEEVAGDTMSDIVSPDGEEYEEQN